MTAKTKQTNKSKRTDKTEEELTIHACKTDESTLICSAHSVVVSADNVVCMPGVSSCVLLGA